MENNELQVFGAIPSKPDVRDYVATTKEQVFPESFQLKLSPVKNQGFVGSCVAHALATVIEYFYQKEFNKMQEMSTGYIYGNRRMSSYKGIGMTTRDAIKTAQHYGSVPVEYFPINSEVPYIVDKFEAFASALKPIGENFKVHNYFRLSDVNAIKASIMENGPVLCGIVWYDDIKIKNGIMHTNKVVSKKTSGHCMVIYGWDTNGWKVRNSWGKAWGDGGNFIIPYDFRLDEVWGIADDISDTSLKLKKPFRSKFGVWLAKILNAIAGFFYNLSHKNKNK